MEDTKAVTSMMWRNQDGTETALIDMTYDQLQRVYNHTTDMLWNNVPYALGRTKVRENVQNAILDCNAELLMRYLLHELEPKVFGSNWDLMQYIINRKREDKLSDTDSATTLFDNLSSVYESVTIGRLLNACFDKLDVINRKMLSDKFILSQGIWLTKKEKEDLTEYEDDGKQRDYRTVILERLFLPLSLHLKIDPKGLSYADFRSLIKMNNLTKISSLTTDTLRLLRDRVLLMLMAEVEYNINKWTIIKEEIEKVADVKHFTLKQKEY